MSRPDVVVVFAKTPRPGAVKTRLEPATGAFGSATLAEAFLADTLENATRLGWARTILSHAGAEPRAAVCPDEVERWEQGEGDLGARLERGLRRALSLGSRAFAIGTDSPGLPVRLLEAARAALDTSDAVLGPTEDGGFYVLGLKRCPEGLLEGLPWSSRETFARTRERLEARGFRVATIAPWFDVDEPEDLARLASLLDARQLVAPRTARALRLLGGPGSRISVVIPTLDEAARIGQRLAELTETPGVADVILVDGGSRDGTREIAAGFGGVVVETAARGRASQMNHGASVAAGETILFLHADTSLPRDAVRWIRRALADPATVGGAFVTRTVADGGPALLAPLLRLADVRSRMTGVPYGDQAIFVRASAFRQLGGFPAQPLMEDLELSFRLRRLGRIRTVRREVQVSGRRFLARPVYFTLLVNAFPLLYRAGVSPTVLAELYDHVR